MSYKSLRANINSNDGKQLAAEAHPAKPLSRLAQLRQRVK
jgi:hypothetical protein